MGGISLERRTNNIDIYASMLYVLLLYCILLKVLAAYKRSSSIRLYTHALCCFTVYIMVGGAGILFLAFCHVKQVSVYVGHKYFFAYT